MDTADPGILLVREWIARARNPIEVLDVAPEAGRRTLLALQVTSRSPMGAIALETGGLLVDDGWVRVLGAGHRRLERALHSWNLLGEPRHRLPQAILVGDDVVGGFFALNGGALPGPLHHVSYLAPDSLEWEAIADSYSGWLQFLCQGDLAKFYDGMRWPGWRQDARELAGEAMLAIYPPLWAKGPPVGERSRRPVPVDEVWGLHGGE